MRFPKNDIVLEYIVSTFHSDILFKSECNPSHGNIAIEVLDKHLGLKLVQGVESALIEGDVDARGALVEAAPAHDALLAHLHHKEFKCGRVLSDY